MLEFSMSSPTLFSPSTFSLLPVPYLVSCWVFLTTVPVLFISFLFCQLPCSYSDPPYSTMYTSEILSHLLLLPWGSQPVRAITYLAAKELWSWDTGISKSSTPPKSSVIAISGKLSNFLSIEHIGLCPTLVLVMERRSLSFEQRTSQ